MLNYFSYLVIICRTVNYSDNFEIFRVQFELKFKLMQERNKDLRFIIHILNINFVIEF